MQSNFYRSLTGLGALLLASAVWGQGHIDSVSAKGEGDSATISIVGQNLPQPKISKAWNYYILQFDAKMDGGNRKIAVGAGGVDSAKLTWFSRRPSRLRLTMHTDGHHKPKLAKCESGWCVYFGDAKPTAVAPKSVAQEAFPTEVPAIQMPHVAASQTVSTVTTVNREMQARVTLDFVNTDVVQILKALAMQANVNIVTSPDVAGKLTVSLGSVPLGQAMDFVTTMSGVRYTRIGDTYVVATPAKFADMVQMLGGHADISTETRVVPLYSHQGSQVKAAVLKSVPISTLLGKYDLLLSSEDIGITQEQRVTPPGATGGAAAPDKQDGGKGNDTNISTRTQAPKGDSPDNYMVIVGTPARLDEVEHMARAVDARICDAMGVRIPSSNGIVQRTYEPRGISAEELVAAMKSDKTFNFGEVQMYATPKTSMSRQVVVISGRGTEVDNMIAVLNTMDTMSDGGPSGMEIVDLKFVRPQLAMIEVLDAVPGIRAKLLPAPVDPNTGVHMVESSRQVSTASGNASPAGGQSGSSGGGGAAGGGASGGSSTSGAGMSGVGVSPIQSAEAVTNWTADTMSYSVPMRLMLRGTAQQIEEAKRFLDMVDVQPKQVALELRVMELSNEDALSVGLNLSLLTGGSLSSLVLNEGLGDASTPGGVSAGLGFKGGGSFKGVGTLDSIANKNNLIARPSILASDGALTHIFVGDQVRYVESIQSTQNGVTIQTNQINVGVDFYVTPRIGGDGNVTLDLRPTFSILEGFTPVPGGGKLPQTSSRSASSIVNIKSGETIAIGGLITDQDQKNYSGIPILKDLPLIGRLFGRTTNDRIRKEVVFFITAREVNQRTRGGAANPKEAERTNTTWPGGGPKEPKKGG